MSAQSKFVGVDLTIEKDDWRLLKDVEFIRGQYLDPVSSNEIIEHLFELEHCLFVGRSSNASKLALHIFGECREVFDYRNIFENRDFMIAERHGIILWKTQ